MAIEKLNFSGANSGYKDFESSGGSIADRLIKYGSYLGDREAEKAKQKSIDDQIIYSRGRDAKEDAYKDADIAEKAAEKNRLLQKEYNTTNALSAISDEKGYTAGRLATEQKAIQDTLSSATPEERLQMQQELKGYDQKASGQQWVNTALSQSNLDSGAVVNLKGDLRKEAEQIRQYDENKRIAKINADRAYSLQKLQYDQSAQEKKDVEAGKLAYVNGLNTNVDDSIKVPIDSKNGEKYIPTEDLEAHKKAYDEFANRKDIIQLKNELVEAQKNGGQIYTKEQLADEKFLYNEYGKLNPKALQKSTLELKGLKIIEDEKKDLEIQKLKEQASAIERSGISDFNTPEENMNAKNKAEAIRSQIITINNERKKGQASTTGSFEDFVANTRASNAAKELDLKTKMDKYDSAYKAQDLKLKNDFGKIKQEEVVIPKTEDEYAQDLYNANTAGKKLSVDEKVGFMKSAKEKASTHQKKVEKAEDDELKVRLKKMEKASEAEKLEYNTYDDQIKSLNDQISKITTGNAGKEDLYSRVTAKEVDPKTAITELRTEIEQLKALQKDLANKTKD